MTLNPLWEVRGVSFARGLPVVIRVRAEDYEAAKRLAVKSKIVIRDIVLIDITKESTE